MAERTLRPTNGRVTRRRKEEHLRISLNNNVSFREVSTGLEDYAFIHQALPEIDFSRVSTETTLAGKRLDAPLVISSMVGGIEAAARINQNLAQAAQALGVGMGVGSQRCSIDAPETASTYQVRKDAPDIILFANLGAVQLNYGYGIIECQHAVDSIDANALMLHLNPLQEVLQREGNTDFTGLLHKIELLCTRLSVPVFVKEIGYGISEEVAHKLAGAGVAGIDVAGAGGTSWSEVERYRARSATADSIAASFGSWGIPTAESIVRARQGAPDIALIASGGIRTGLDVAKSIALGADVSGIALPLLKAASVSAEAVITLLQQVVMELRIAMFCVGAASIQELRYSPFLEKRARRQDGLLT